MTVTVEAGVETARTAEIIFDVGGSSKTLVVNQAAGPINDPEPEPEKKTISVLAIGNSFSVDGMQYLYDILKESGIETVVLGNLYIGSCSLSTHASNFSTNSASYTYYHNSTGSWASPSAAATTVSSNGASVANTSVSAPATDSTSNPGPAPGSYSVEPSKKDGSIYRIGRRGGIIITVPPQTFQRSIGLLEVPDFHAAHLSETERRHGKWI